MQTKLHENITTLNKNIFVCCRVGWQGFIWGVCEYEGVAGTHVTSEPCVCSNSEHGNKQFKNREYRNQQYLFQSFLAVFLRGRDEFTGLDRRRRASRLRRGRLRLQLGGNYKIQKHKTDVTKYISWGWCTDFIASCFCFDETETNTMHKEADYITLLKYHITKKGLNISIRKLFTTTSLLYISNKTPFLHTVAVPLVSFSVPLNLHLTFQFFALIS